MHSRAALSAAPNVVSVTRRDTRRAMDQIYSRAPEGNDYPVVFTPAGPEDRGHVGRVHIRSQNGSEPRLRDVWWLRCPWCREMVEIPIGRLHVDAGRVRIQGTIVCQHCETAYRVDDGRAQRCDRSPDVEREGRADVTSDSVEAS